MWDEIQCQQQPRARWWTIRVWQQNWIGVLRWVASYTNDDEEFANESKLQHHGWWQWANLEVWNEIEKNGTVGNDGWVKFEKKKKLWWIT
jgi:hypothetical protein